MEDFEEDLDTSWIETAEFQDNYEREPMKEIGLFFIYIHLDGSIEKIAKEYETIDDNMGLSKERILRLIQSKRHCIGKKYRLIDLLSFYVTLEPGQLSDFVNSEDRADFLNSLPIFDEVLLEPSIFIFHDLNGLFFFFKEVESFPTKSILKNGDSGNENKRTTKKVRISPEEYIEKKKKSLKRMLRRANKTRKM